MTEQEWQTSTDPAAMLRWLTTTRRLTTRRLTTRRLTTREPSPCDGASGWERQLRLFACACHRIEHGNGFHRGYKVAEESDGKKDDWTGIPVKLAQVWCQKSSFRSDLTSSITADLLRCIFGNPFRPMVTDRAYIMDAFAKAKVQSAIQVAPRDESRPWREQAAERVDGLVIRQSVLTPTVLSIAQNIHESGDWSAMPVLADALLEAGMPEAVECKAIGPHHRDMCKGGRIQSPNAQFTRDCPSCGGSGRLLHPVLEHCRSGRTHAKGCWVIELLLGKE